MTWDKYHSKEDMEEYLDYLANKYPELVSIEFIGKSFEGREMRVAKVNFSNKTFNIDFKILPEYINVDDLIGVQKQSVR